MKVKEANSITGHKSGLGRTSKMPGYSTAISAHDCKMGVKLAKIEGTICSRCYALKGNYQFPDVRAGHARRLQAISDPRWVEGMAFLIDRRCILTDPDLAYFRWFDSGDLQSLEHLIKIFAVARLTPQVSHWLATREIGFLRKYDRLVKHSLQPYPSTNMIVRVSSNMVGQEPLKRTPSWAVTSTVDWKNAPRTCPSLSQGNACLTCRACWDASVPNVNYLGH